MTDDQTDELIDQRKQVYGDPKVTFPQIAQVFSGILGIEVRADQVPLLMIGMKLVRTSQTPGYSDNSDDIAGYLDIFRTVMGERLIHARTVDEYIDGLAATQDAEVKAMEQQVRDQLAEEAAVLLNLPVVLYPAHKRAVENMDRWVVSPVKRCANDIVRAYVSANSPLHQIAPSYVVPGDIVTWDHGAGAAHVLAVNETSFAVASIHAESGYFALYKDDAEGLRFYVTDKDRPGVLA